MALVNGVQFPPGQDALGLGINRHPANGMAGGGTGQKLIRCNHRFLVGKQMLQGQSLAQHRIPGFSIGPAFKSIFPEPGREQGGPFVAQGGPGLQMACQQPFQPGKLFQTQPGQIGIGQKMDPGIFGGIRTQGLGFTCLQWVRHGPIALPVFPLTFLPVQAKAPIQRPLLPPPQNQGKVIIEQLEIAHVSLEDDLVVEHHDQDLVRRDLGHLF